MNRPTQSISRDAEGAVRLRLPDGAHVDLSIPSGELRIEGTDGDEVVLRARNSAEPLDRLVEIVETDRGIVIRGSRDREHRLGFLRLSTGPDVELDVEVPRGASISARTASAGITATELAGAGRWTSASGRVRLALDGGSATVETASGNVDVQATADVTLVCRTVSGDVDIRAETVSNLVCRTVSGDVDVHARRLDAMRIDTTSGDVTLDGSLGMGAHEVGTLSGTVRIATDSEVRLQARTVVGRIDVRVPHRIEGSGGSRVILVGTGTVPVRAQAMSGDISLRAAGVTEGRARSPEASAADPVPPAARVPADRIPAGRVPGNQVPADRPAGGLVPPAPRHEPPAEPFRGTGIDRRQAARLDEFEDGGSAGSPGARTSPEAGDAAAAGFGAASSIRIQVRDGGRSVVNLRLPLGLGRFAIDRVPGLASHEVETVREALRLGLRGSILEVTEPDGDGVSIVLE